MSKKLLSVNTLKIVLENRNTVKNNIKDYHEKADWETFQLAMRLLNPQSYGAQFEKRIRTAYKWNKNSAKDRIGDASYILNTNKINTEIKISLTTEFDKNVNILQIRDSHNIDYYDIFIIHIDNTVERFRLSKDQMSEELLNTGLSLAHGTKGNEDYMYKNAEYRIDFKATSDDLIYKRWKEKYLLVDGEKELINYKPFDKKKKN